MVRDDSDIGRNSRTIISAMTPKLLSLKTAPKRGTPGRARRRRRNTDDSVDSSSASTRASMIGRLFSRKKNGTPTSSRFHIGRSESISSGDGSMDKDFARVSIEMDGVPELPRGILKNSRGRQAAKQTPTKLNDPTHTPYQLETTSDRNTADATENAEDVQYDYDDTDPMPRRTPGERARYSVYHGQVKRKMRVRPYHLFPLDFKMTEEEIYADSMKPSQNFIFLKSYLAPTSKEVEKMDAPIAVSQLFGSPQEDARIGALRVEVLGCIALPRTKPDIAVYMVCGDAAFASDVLSGYRSPIWPSLSRRAAVFPLHHAFAQLYVGVFDVRANKNKENDVFCGRVSLDIAALRSDTEYDVTFPLRASTFVYDRRKRGVIRLRFSVHWFSERAALVSYFKKPKSLTSCAPLYHGSPTIPCADPKTFRNVAFTVYGQDLPGKYSRNAFKSTMREYTLYQQNTTLLAQMLALDAIFYERPHISLYLFLSGMYCISSNSISLVPAVFVGYIIILFIENYMHYIDGTKFNMGYRPHTLQEILNGLIGHASGAGGFFEPALVEKKTKRKRGYECDAKDDKDEVEIEPLDHREFPFSDRDAYPKWSVEDALAPSSNKKNGGNTRLHGRLSVYYTAAPPTGGDKARGEDEDDASEDSENDDETIDTTDTMFNLDYDVDDDLDESEHETLHNAYQHQDNLLNPTVTKTRYKLGPPQDVDKRGAKVPPQLQLQKTERRIHDYSFKIAVEPIFAPTNIETGLDVGITKNTTVESREMMMLNDQNSALKKRKAVYDEFDKLLGLKSRSANPLNRIMSSFLGPLMRMCRISLYAFRISYHTFSWRDPFFSFWVLVALCAVCLILVAFPWRQFFFLIVLGALGPQNIFVRRYLEKRLKEKALKAIEEEENFSLIESKDSISSRHNASVNDITSVDEMRKSAWFATSTKHKKKQKNEAEAELVDERPPFLPNHHANASKKVQPRSVVIPYSRLKKDRFYDWPPDPTVSKATPLSFRTESKSNTKLLARSDSNDSKGPLIEASTPDDDLVPKGLRRRPQPTIQSELPMNLYL
ncbi:hypothetical protein FisN_8Lh168 [Fistulifera solaris]|uniref:C2 domain-containing protein n=1 Tax=Fistulifera solaris TaxID=1519565 RepID=A0A1Z5JDP8_FISSO|nr:hypothetical protein FisN_8Lh168 [Fistulifera solaris]|eukprot:GAX12066.1 hypothetical protein FisN_8Lh168 [Fistulifera solaris]